MDISIKRHLSIKRHEDLGFKSEVPKNRDITNFPLYPYLKNTL